jgi:hypothetical protein
LESQQRVGDVCHNECEQQCAGHAPYGRTGYRDVAVGRECGQKCPGNAHCPALTSNCEAAGTGRLMFGVGVNSQAGLVGHVTLNCDNFDIARCACGDKCPCHTAALRAACPAECQASAEDLLVSASLNANRSRDDDEDDDDTEEAVDSLRGASEMLDHMAGTLERKELYLRADQLRDIAHQLRHDARQAKSNPTSGLGGHAAEWTPREAPPPMPVVWDLPPAGPPAYYPGPQFVQPNMPIMRPYPPMISGPYTPGGYSPGVYTSPEPLPTPQPGLVAPVPPPTYEQASREKDLEREVHMLRDELRKLHQVLSSRSEEPRR